MYICFGHIIKDIDLQIVTLPWLCHLWISTNINTMMRYTDQGDLLDTNGNVQHTIFTGLLWKQDSIENESTDNYWFFHPFTSTSSSTHSILTDLSICFCVYTSWSWPVVRVLVSGAIFPTSSTEKTITKKKYRGKPIANPPNLPHY